MESRPEWAAGKRILCCNAARLWKIHLPPKVRILIFLAKSDPLRL